MPYAKLRPSGFVRRARDRTLLLTAVRTSAHVFNSDSVFHMTQQKCALRTFKNQTAAPTAALISVEEDRLATILLYFTVGILTLRNC